MEGSKEYRRVGMCTPEHDLNAGTTSCIKVQPVWHSHFYLFGGEVPAYDWFKDSYPIWREKKWASIWLNLTKRKAR